MGTHQGTNLQPNPGLQLNQILPYLSYAGNNFEARNRWRILFDHGLLLELLGVSAIQVNVHQTFDHPSVAKVEFPMNVFALERRKQLQVNETKWGIS